MRTNYIGALIVIPSAAEESICTLYFLVILRLAEESSLSAHKLYWSVSLQDPSPSVQDDKMIVLDT